MHALVYRETGLVLDSNYPQSKPIDGQALIDVLLAGICKTDLEIVRSYMSFRGVLAMSLWVPWKQCTAM